MNCPHWYDNGEGSEKVRRAVKRASVEEKPLMQTYLELRAENAELRKACEQALSDFRFIEKTLPNSNFTSTIILLMEALKGGQS